MKDIVMTLLAEGVDEGTIHEVLNVLEDKWDFPTKDHINSMNNLMKSIRRERSKRANKVLNYAAEVNAKMVKALREKSHGKPIRFTGDDENRLID